MSVLVLWEFLGQGSGEIYAASDEEVGYPADNTQLPALADDRWRAKTAASDLEEYIRFDLGIAAAVNYCAILGHTEGVVGEVPTWTGATSSDMIGSPIAENIGNWVGKTGSITLFNEMTKRFHEFRIPKDSDYSFYAGRVIFGLKYETLQGIAPEGIRWGGKDLSKIVRPKSGSKWVDVGAFMEMLRIQFRAVPTSQKDEFMAMAKAIGLHTPFILIPDDSDPSIFIYGSFTKIPEAKARGNGMDYWDIDFRVMEDL